MIDTNYLAFIKLILIYLTEKSDINPHDILGERSHVDFIATPGRPQPVVPPIICEDAQDILMYLDDVQTTFLPSSQISVVNNSYIKTIGFIISLNLF